MQKFATYEDDQESVVVRDLNSTNGTFESRKVSEQDLHHNDLLQVGSKFLRYWHCRAEMQPLLKAST